MDDNIMFSPALLNKLEELAFLNMVTATSTEEQAKQIKVFVRAFTKRGVPMKTILGALLEINNEQRKESDNL